MEDPAEWMKDLLAKINASREVKVLRLSELQDDDRPRFESLVEKYVQHDDLLRVLIAYEPDMMASFATEVRSYRKDEFRRKLPAWRLCQLPFPFQSHLKGERAEEVIQWIEANPQYLTLDLDNLAQSMCCHFMMETPTHSYDHTKTLTENLQTLLNGHIPNPFE
jgi:hypothetical protein